MKESSFVVQVLLELQATSSEEGMLWIKRTSRRAMREKKRRRRRRGGTRGGERGEKEGRKGKKGGTEKPGCFLFLYLWFSLFILPGIISLIISQNL
jgi:hypothetical protein